MIELQQIGAPRVIDTILPESKPHTITARMSSIRAFFDNYREVTNGNPVWAVTIYSDKLIKYDIDPLWQGLTETAHCFKEPVNYVPFGHDGCTFCYSLYDGGTQIYDFSKQTRIRSKVNGIWSILCAPKEPMILISGTNEETKQDGVYLVDFDGNIIRRIEALDETPDAFLSWLKYSQSILAISKKSWQNKTWIYEIDPETGTILHKREFGPQNILPFNDLSYNEASGENALLQTSIGKKKDGLLLNMWEHLSYDFGFKKLRARICHPSIESLKSENQPSGAEIEGVFYEYEFKITFS